MIRYLIIMKKDTGIPLFSQSYGFDTDENCEQFDGKMSFLGPEMLGGFLATLMGFGSQFNYGDINEISFQEIQILSQHSGNIVTVAVEEKGEGSDITKGLLGTITRDFLALFGEGIEDWDGDAAHFIGFEDHILDKSLVRVQKRSCRDCSACPDSKQCIPKMIKNSEPVVCDEVET